MPATAVAGIGCEGRIAMTATQRRGNMGVLTGSLFVVLWVAGTVVQGMSGAGFPRPTDDMATVADYMRDGASHMERSAGLSMLCALALLWFACVLAGYLRREGRPGSSPELVLGGGITAAVALLASAAPTVALGTTDLVNDDASAQMMYQLLFWLGGPIHVAALGTMLVAAASGLAGPKWLTISGLVVGAVGMLSALAPLVGPLMIATPIGRFAGFLWIVVMTVLVAFRRSPAPAAAEPARV
jgi:hypothetical protein